MNKKIFFVIFLFILTISLYGCGKTNEYYVDDFISLRSKAYNICDDRNGELIHFGSVLNPNNGKHQFEGVCYKEDERHFYYDLIEE